MEYDRNITVNDIQIWNTQRRFPCEFLGFRSSAFEVSILLVGRCAVSDSFPTFRD